MSTNPKFLSALPKVLDAASPLLVNSRKQLISELKSIGVRKKLVAMSLLPVTSGHWAAVKYVGGQYASITSLDASSNQIPVSVEAGLGLRVPQELSPTYDIKSLFGYVVDRPVVYVIGQINCAKKHRAAIKAGLPKIKTLNKLGRMFLASTVINPKLADLLQFTAVDSLLAIDGKLIRPPVPPCQLESHLTSLGFSAYSTNYGTAVSSVTAQSMFSEYTDVLELCQSRNQDFKIAGLRPVSWRADDSSYRNIVWQPQEK